MANIRKYQTTVVPDMGASSAELELALFGICGCESYLDTAKSVFYPEGFPTTWMKDGFVSPKTLLTAKQRGWNLVTFSPSIFPSPSPAYLVPPEQVMAQLLKPAAYQTFVDAGVFKSMQRTFVSGDFGEMAPFHGVMQMLNGNFMCLRSDGLFSRPEDVNYNLRAALSSGYIIVTAEGSSYLVPSNDKRSVLYGYEYADQNLSDGLLLYFQDLGLLSIRSESGLPGDQNRYGPIFVKDAAPHFARPKEPLDPKSFEIDRRQRWGGAFVKAAVPAEAISEGIFSRYPQISSLLEGYRFFLEPRELKTIARLLERMESSEKIVTQEGIAHTMMGAFGKIAFRAELFDIYNKVLAVRPNALLLLQGDFGSIDGVDSSSALIGELVSSPDGSTMRIYALYNITTNNSFTERAEYKLERQKLEKLRESIHLKMPGSRGITIPVEADPVFDAGGEVFVLDQRLADEMRSAVDAALQTVILRFGETKLGMLQSRGPIFVTRLADRVPIQTNLHSMTNECLDSLAEDKGAPLFIHGNWAGGKAVGLSLVSESMFESGEGLSDGYFTLKLVRAEDGWQVVYAKGSNVKAALNNLRGVQGGPQVPSYEKLSEMAGLTMSLSEFDSVNSFTLMDRSQVDLWAREYGGETVKLSGVAEKDGRVTAFRVNDPGNYQHFAVELQPQQDGRWKVVTVSGVNVTMILDSLRMAGPWLEVPSNEWLSKNSGLFKSLTAYDVPSAYSGITHAILDKWAGDFNTPDAVEISGALNSGQVFGFEINESPRIDRRFYIRFEKKDGVWSLVSAQGDGIEPILKTLQAATSSSGLTVPSNEWLSIGTRYSMTEYTTVESLKGITTVQLDQWRKDYSSDDFVVSGLYRNDGSVSGFVINGEKRENAFFLNFQWKDGKWRIVELYGKNGVRPVLEAMRAVPKDGAEVPSDEFVLTGKNIGSRFTTLESLKGISPALLDQWSKDFETDRIEIGGAVDSRELGNIGGFGVNKPRRVVSFYVTFVKAAGIWIVADAGNKNAIDVVDALRGVDGIYVPSNEWFTANRDGKNFSAIDSLTALSRLTVETMEKWWLEFKTAFIELSGARDYAVQDPGAITNFKINAEREPKRFFVRLNRGLAGEWKMVEHGGPVSYKAASAVQSSPFGLGIATTVAGNVVVPLVGASVVDLLGGAGSIGAAVADNVISDKLKLHSEGPRAKLDVTAAINLEKALDVARKVEATGTKLKGKVDKK